MAVRKVLRMGHPVLREPARELTSEEIRSAELERLVVDMVDTLRDYGGVGLAAPQVGEPVRLAIIEIAGGTSRYGEIPSIPLSAFVNPVVDVLDGTTRGLWEGCLSVPGLRGYVERPQRVRVRYTDLESQAQELEAEGFLATVLQHELDHLDGTLYIDRLSDTRLLAFDAEFERYLAPREDAESLD